MESRSDVLTEAKRSPRSKTSLGGVARSKRTEPTIRPGRVNVWGTIAGVAILAVGISGIQQLGGAFYVEPLFNGVTLLLAIGLAGYAQRKRGKVRHKPARISGS